MGKLNIKWAMFNGYVELPDRMYFLGKTNMFQIVDS